MLSFFFDVFFFFVVLLVVDDVAVSFLIAAVSFPLAA
jgi:hypothetical protein